ncbi:hypothetical protein D3C71_2010660 [compost metagenome]
MRGQTLVQAGTGVEVVDRAAVAQGRGKILDRRVAQAVEHFLAQAGDQHAMLAADAFDRVQ